jgi:hypothetical protein
MLRKRRWRLLPRMRSRALGAVTYCSVLRRSRQREPVGDREDVDRLVVGDGDLGVFRESTGLEVVFRGVYLDPLIMVLPMTLSTAPSPAMSCCISNTSCAAGPACRGSPGVSRVNTLERCRRQRRGVNVTEVPLLARWR